MRKQITAISVVLLVCGLGAATPGHAREIAFKAAGVMPYTIRGGAIMFLVGGERRQDCFSDGAGYCWATFTGRRDSSETSPAQTAAREFLEETRHVFSPAPDGRRYDADRVARSPRFQSHKDGIYIYLVRVPFVPSRTIGERRSQWTTEKSSYCWVSREQLLSAVDRPPHVLPSQCGRDSPRLFEVFRKDLVRGESLRHGIEGLTAD